MSKIKKRKIKFEISAGGIVFKILNLKSKILKIQIGFILDPYGKWTFAKGHIHKKEKVEAAARREVEEEMGLKDLKVIERLGKMDFWFRWGGNLIHKLVYYFLMQTPARTKFTVQKKEKIFKAKWVDIDEAVKFSDYKNVRPLLKKAILIIKKQKDYEEKN